MKIIKRVFIALMIVCVLAYLIPLFKIISNQKSSINSKVDYLIVLGAKVNEDGVSKTLQYRLDKAVEYYHKYPETKIIVSGGQGQDEPKSEAVAMKEYLLLQEVTDNKIIVEKRATSTYENLKYSKAIIEQESDNARIGIVTTDFHIYRSKLIAKRVFKQQCDFLASKNYNGIAGLYSLLREPLAFYKTLFFDKK